MRGKGKAQVRRWRNALAVKRESLLREEELPKLLELPYREKKDHAEGLTLVGQRGDRVTLMVLYDSADKDRRLPPAAMWATVHALTLPRLKRLARRAAARRIAAIAPACLMACTRIGMLESLERHFAQVLEREPLAEAKLGDHIRDEALGGLRLRTKARRELNRRSEEIPVILDGLSGCAPILTLISTSRLARS